jgi:2,4-dienoyl-CoA reductase-like NADH-dependent reductase (Old Yellow Enzyme family)
MSDYPPTVMSQSDTQRTIKRYVSATQIAIQGSGFDGIELHAGNGYLVEQFLSSNVNVRTDEYGRSPEKRC